MFTRYDALFFYSSIRDCTLMQIGIYGSGTSESAFKTIKKILSSADIDSFTITKSKNKSADCIIVLGGDKGVRNYFHRTIDTNLH